jgi:hypothetical protein
MAYARVAFVSSVMSRMEPRNCTISKRQA